MSESKIERWGWQLHQAINCVLKTRIEYVEDVVHQGAQNLGGENVVLVEANYPIATDFKLFFDPSSNGVPDTPCILISPELILSLNPLALQADLVRTLAIASQFPRGYARRLHDAYDEALDVQKLWLRATNSPLIEFDPRTQDRESILREILGDDRYFPDVGIQDLETVRDYAISDARGLGKSENTIMFIKEMPLDDAVLMIKEREASAPVMHSFYFSHYGEDYLNWSSDRRANIFARAIILGRLERMQREMTQLSQQMQTARKQFGEMRGGSIFSSN